jgi:hypothetical protein
MLMAPRVRKGHGRIGRKKRASSWKLPSIQNDHHVGFMEAGALLAFKTWWRYHLEQVPTRKKFHPVTYFLCVNRLQKKLTVSKIKGCLHDLMPKNTHVTRQQIFNMRVKVTKLLPTINDNPDYAAFKNYVNDVEIVHGLDDELKVNNDMANKMATQLWMEELAEKDTPDSIQTLTCYMNLLAGSAPGFSHSIATDDTGLATGLAWMTGTMRDNFERYNTTISLDCKMQC